MTRCLFSLVWLLALVAAFPASVQAQDRIKYTDKTGKKEAEATGTIQEESPAGVTYKPGAGGASRQLSAVDIIDIIYELPGGVRLEYGRVLTDEKKAADPATPEKTRKKAFSDALEGYKNALTNLTGEKYVNARRHIQFKLARLLARAAEEDSDQIDPALEALQKFKKDHPESWQITACAKLLARLQLARGDSDAAEKTYQDLAATRNLPKPVRQECDLLVAQALIRGKKYAEAQSKLEELLKALAPDDPQAARVRISAAQCRGASGKLAEAVKELESMINSTSDKDLKATAYNALGDCYRLNSKPKEAIWPYLWVDVIYHQDRQEHVRAMEQLAKLFEELGDKDRAQQYKDRLKKENK